MNYYDYFPEEEHMDEDVPMDEFITEATRTDIRFQTLAEELQFLRKEGSDRCYGIIAEGV